MGKKKRGLGSLGVDVLLSAAETQAASNAPTFAGTDKSLQNLPIEKILQSPYQPRQIIQPEALESLADSIRQQGVVQPIVVRKVAGEFELIAGERRWRAAQQAGLQEIPAVIKEVDDQQAAAIALIENIQREDLNPLEEAQAFTNLIMKFGLTHQEVGELVSRSRAAVSNSLRLMTLAEPVKQMLNENQLEMGHARALLALDKTNQVKFAKSIINRKLSVRGAEDLVKQAQNKSKASKSKSSKNDPDITRLEQKISDQIGANVSIQHKGNGAGNMQIHYSSLDELEGIVEKLLSGAK